MGFGGYAPEVSLRNPILVTTIRNLKQINDRNTVTETYFLGTP